jgi:hypothetical protein
VVDAPTDPVTDPSQALRIAAVEKVRLPRNHSNNYGVFFSKKYQKLHAVVNGESRAEPAVFLIYYGDMTWYMEAMLIIAETFESVARDDRSRIDDVRLVVSES